MSLSSQYKQENWRNEGLWYVILIYQFCIEAEQKAKDKFSVLREQISKKIHFIRSTLQRKPLSRGMTAWNTEQDEQLKQKLRQVNSCIIRIKDSVNQERSNANTKQLKKQIIQKLQEQYRSYQKLIYDQNQTENSQRSLLNSAKKNQTLTDMKSQLLQDNQSTIYGTNKNRKNRNTKANQIQLQKIQEWKQQQRQIDDKVDIINEKVTTLKSTINQTGKLITEIDAKVNQLTSNVDSLTQELVKSNKKLKGVVEKFRKPHKFCIDIILTLILIGLIVGIIKVAST